MTQLISSDAAQALAAKTLKLVKADDATVTINDTRGAVTRYAGSAITQNVDAGGTFLSVTVAFGAQRGTASAATIDPADIESAVRRAEAIAKLSPPDPEYLPPLGPQTYAPTPASAFDPATANLSPEARARNVQIIVQRAQKAGLSAAGTVESGQYATAIANSKGLFGYYAASSATIGCTLTGKDSTGWARDSGPEIALLQPATLADQAAQQAAQTAAPRTLAPGKYTTILLPAAAGYMISPIIQGLDARETDDGVTFLSGKAGQKLVGDNITLRSEPRNPRIPDAPFDQDGVPVTEQTWIKNGVFNQLAYDRFTAKKHGVAPVSISGSYVMDGTDKSIADLIAGTEQGVMVTHFWYVRDIKPDETTQTGMTRDSVFWIENGKIAYGLKHMRWNESSLRVLSNVLDMSKPYPNVDNETGLSLLPALKVADFHFVSGTEF